MLLDHRGYRLSLLTRAFRVKDWTYYIHWLTTIVIMYRISIFPVIVPKVFIAEMKRQRYDRRNGQYIFCKTPYLFVLTGRTLGPNITLHAPHMSQDKKAICIWIITPTSGDNCFAWHVPYKSYNLQRIGWVNGRTEKVMRLKIFLNFKLFNHF